MPESEERKPYVGPYAFEEADAGFFFGREREAQILPSKVISNQVTLFFAQSGAGKTSLLNTRVVPSLKAEGFDVLPVTRVSGELPAGIVPDNVYAFNTVWWLTGAQDARPLRHLSLDEYLRPSGANGCGTDSRRVLILDQFEEVLTTHPDRWREREDFFLQLRQSLFDDPALSLVLVMREDHVAGIERYAAFLPGHARSRFRMERLRREDAIEAVRQPAAAAGRPFDDKVAERLVENLCQIRVAGQEKTVSGEFVEPVQLQVVCFQLWENLRQRPPGTITFDDLEKFGKVDEALESFYEREVATTARKTGVAERRIRTWCGATLITPSRIRSQVSREDGQTGGLPNPAVDRLVEAHLIRPEPARGGTWYELAHDLFIEPVLRSNEAWLRLRETPLAADARAWREAGRDPLLLYRGRRLAAARELQKADPDAIGPVEREFLTSSGEEDALLSKRQVWLLVTALVVVVLFASVAFWQSLIAARESRLSSSRELALAAIGKSGSDPDLGLLLALEAVAKETTPAAEAALHETLNASVVRQAWSFSFDFANVFASSPDGTRIAAAGDQGTVGVWDAKSRQPVFQLRTGNGTAGDVSPILTIAFDRTGRRLATGDGQGHVVVRDAASGKALWTMRVGASVNALAFSPTGRWLAVASDAAAVSLWELGVSRQPRLLHGHESRVWDVAFSRGGQVIATVGEDGRIFLWDAGSGNVLRQFAQQAEPVTGVAFSPDGRLATAGQDRVAILWNPETGTAEQFLRGHDDWVWDVAFSHDGRYLATSSFDGTAKIWDTRSHNELYTLSPEGGEVVSVAFGREPGTLITVSRPAGSTKVMAAVWHVLFDGDVTTLFSDKASFHRVAFSPDGRLIATAARQGPATLWTPSGGKVSSLPLAGRSIRDLAFASQAGERYLLATAQADGQIFLWDVSGQSPHRQATLGAVGAPVNKVAFSPVSPQRLATAGADGVARIWNLTTPAPQQMHVLRVSRGSLLAVAFSPDGKSLATADKDGVVRLSDLETGRMLPPLRDQSPALHVAFSPQGTILATVGLDGTVSLWDLATRRLLFEPLRGHTAAVTSAEFSPGGDRLATSSADSTVKFWDVARGRELFTLHGHRSAVEAVAFSPAGNLAATVSDDRVRLEPLAIADLAKLARQRLGGRRLNEQERRIYLHD